MNKKSQNEQIKAHLESGKSITPLEAFSRFGCMRLSGRIHDLRHIDNMPIKSELIEVKGKHVAQYSLHN